ncbi:MAG: hypothetical protein PUC35_08970 [Prevotellaceae bacterium]|nr:hypothetical protein [Prevotellaceae bacterium]
MARITPIDVIKGISGKYGGNSNDYFATNKSSSKIHLAKFANPYTGPSTEKQVAQRMKFTERQMAITAWLNANKPSEANGMKGTAAYQWAQKMKKSMALSSITQVLYKYLDEENNIVLPEGAGEANTPTVPSDSVTEKYLLTLAVNDPQMGSVSGGGEYAADTEVELKATANSGYVFVKWSDGDTNASRTYTTTAEAVTLTAEFKAEAEDGGEMGE